MADRVKYFLLGLLFLVVAGVIAYDRWNADPSQVMDAANEADRTWEVVVGRDEPEPELPPARKLSVPAEIESPPSPADPPPEKVAPPRAIDPPREVPPPVVKREPPKESPPKSARPVLHTVRPGETLESIAMRYYKNRKGIAWIVDANRLKDPDKIFQNQKLVIPARKELKKSTPKRKPDGKIPQRYRVKAGDGDLYAICRRFYGRKGEGARVAHVMELNHLWSAQVKAGTVLILPPK